jgi:hypothetical protein
VLLFGDDAESVHDGALASGVALQLQGIRPAGLEDVFLHLTGRSLRD